jgi:predicted SnoaL-like aldol condensation-catalyzing enzyme
MKTLLIALSLAVAVCPAPAQNPAAMKQKAREIVALINQKKYDACNAYFATNFKNHQTNRTGQTALTDDYRALHKTTPDAKVALNRLLAEGDWLYIDFDVVGRGLRRHGIGVVRFDPAGRIAERWFFAEQTPTTVTRR